MLSKKQLQTYLIICFFVIFVLAKIKNIPFSFSILTLIPEAAGIVFGCAFIFNKWLWKWKIFYPWLVSIPNISGSWKGEIISSWIDPETQKSPPPIEAYLVVKQTYSNIEMTLMTIQSSSDAIVASLAKSSNGYKFCGIYNNQPKATLLKNSPMHLGTFMVDIHNNEILSLEGCYWTNRDTKGELKFYAHKKKFVYGFENCKKQFSL
jgi:hypothetical protein